MSLRVWLPLTKDLRNQGLDDVTVINNGATFNANGKLGGCYQFGTSNSYITVDSTPLKTFTEFSFACWVKIISWNTSYSTIFAAKNSTGVSWNNLVFSLLRNSSNSTLCFNIAGNGGYTSTSCQTDTLSLNTWYHITCTYKSGQIKLYQDGSVVSIYNISVVPNFSSIVNLWIGKSNENSYQSNILLNDVRIYNHVLSPLEVKQISQGLILHYPLNRGGFGQENFYTGNGIYPCGTGISSYTNDGYVHHSVWSNSGTARAQNLGFNGKTGPWTVSFNIKSSVNATLTVDVCDKRYATATYGINLIKDTWMHKSFIITTPTDQYNTSSAYNGFVDFNYSTAGTLDIKNLKVEEGTIETPWCPNLTNELVNKLGLNDNIEYDCSGFCNNGTRIGTFSWTSDTPKYNVSTNILNGSYIDTGYKENIGTGDFTVSVWIKMPQTSGKSYQPIFSNKTTGAASVGFAIYFNQNQNKLLWSTADGSAATEIWMANTINIYDKWMHIVMVRNASDAKKGYFYINGERYELASVPVIRNITNETYNIQIGDIATHNNSAYRYVGLMSDFRIYATALSAEDIKDLYNLGASIDSNNNLLTYELNEE